MPLKVEIVVLILVVKTILKKPASTSMIFLVLKSIRLQSDSIVYDRPHMTTKKPTRYSTDNKDGLIAYAIVVAQEVPEGIECFTYCEAISYPNSSNWFWQRKDEMKSLYKNET